VPPRRGAADQHSGHRPIAEDRVGIVRSSEFAEEVRLGQQGIAIGRGERQRGLDDLERGVDVSLGSGRSSL
jgi:hypothetical protein